MECVVHLLVGLSVLWFVNTNQLPCVLTELRFDNVLGISL